PENRSGRTRRPEKPHRASYSPPGARRRQRAPESRREAVAPTSRSAAPKVSPVPYTRSTHIPPDPPRPVPSHPCTRPGGRLRPATRQSRSAGRARSVAAGRRAVRRETVRLALAVHQRGAGGVAYPDRVDVDPAAHAVRAVLGRVAPAQVGDPSGQRRRRVGPGP